MACTCRSFESLVLDRLWYNQESLSPLFKCLPHDSWEEIVETLDDIYGEPCVPGDRTTLVSEFQRSL